ncbi:MAG: MBL fold metallo-hydrolase [Candidatus Cloacimonetes bacterium 4572_65]|nr:MAG: MBL fold metallo-hydrolase [Candidatus Cloacimonetes bacterium 4572_65]
MKPIKLKENIYWVGAIDWNQRDFHGYLTQKGTSYNAYLIIDEKITLVDGVKAQFTQEMLTRISHIIDPSKIDYIIHNHVEMDHSGSLPEMLKIAPNAEIVSSPNGSRGLKAHHGTDFDIKIVKTGNSLNIGKRNLNFVLTPMVHWPDNMVCYCPEEEILFSNDSFGQHIASSHPFDKDYPLNILFHEAKKYYANIVLPYGSQVIKALEIVKQLNPKMIAPSHGIIWEEHISEIIDLYDNWASNKVAEKAMIIYDTMWKSTEKIAHAIADGFEEKNIPFEFVNLKATHISDIMTNVIDSKYICIGSPTLNNNILPTVAAFLAYLKGLAPKKRTAVAFGSYGWGGQSIGLIREDLEKCGFTVWDNIKTSYIPSDKFLKEVTEKIVNNIDSQEE